VWSLPLEFLLSRLSAEFDAGVREALEAAPPWRWKEVDLACLDRDFARAAEMWAEAGSPTWEARCRLRAAEELSETGRLAEAAEQAQKALAFYRTVRAAYYVERCEALLAEAKSA
jgi:hypothetical protein